MFLKFFFVQESKENMFLKFFFEIENNIYIKFMINPKLRTPPRLKKKNSS